MAINETIISSVVQKVVEQLIKAEKIQQQALELEAALKAEKEISAFQNQLVSVVSHEIRTPLSIIDGSARRIGGKAEQLSGDEIRQRTDTIRLSVRRLTQLVERTLESSRYAEDHIALKPSEFDPKAFLTGIIARERESATSHVFNLSVDGLPDRGRAPDDAGEIAKLDSQPVGDMLAAMRAAEARGHEIVGVWHSHTHTDAYPSPTDVRQAVDPAWLYVIVSLRDQAPVLRSYRIRDGQIAETPVALDRG